MTTITLPNNWRPRPYQRDAWRYLERGGKRAIEVWHRRSGKDDVGLHWAAVASHQRIGTYWHMLPEASQARKAIWEAINPHTGKRRIDEAFPRGLRANTRENEMMIRLKCGSTWQIVGSDNYNSLVGSPPVGVVFSEYALADPHTWGYIRPILAENDGWTLFISTPRGRNHLHRMVQAHDSDADWHVSILPATKTGVFTPEQLERERRELIEEYGEQDGEARFRQEYLCSFDAAIVGAYYAAEIEAAEAQGRITKVPWEPSVAVHTAWDLGISDSTAIWLYQKIGREIHVIGYIENAGVGLDWYVNKLREFPYTWGDHILPHDAKARELGTGKSRLETLHSLGFGSATVTPAQSVADGINAARMLLPRCWFDAESCAPGIDGLRQYRRRWSEDRKMFDDRPYHDWTSHPADAFRYMAMNIDNEQPVLQMSHKPRARAGGWMS